MPPANGRATPGARAFLTNHARVLARLAADPTARMRDVAADTGLTERAVHKIVAELTAAGYLTVRRVGRQNRYDIDRRRPLGHPLEAHLTVGELIDVATKNNGRIQS